MKADSSSVAAKPEYHISANALNAFRFGELWRYRHLAVLLALRQIKARYKQTALGLLWAIIVPIAFTAIFVLFFRLVPARPSRNLPYLPVVFAGMLMWQLFSRGTTDAGTSLTANANLITKVYFPRTILPFAAIFSALFDAAISFVLLVLVLFWFDTGLSWHMLLMPAVVLQMVVLVLATSLWLSAIDGILRDLRHALPLLLQLGMFVSPVAYTTSALVPEKWLWLYEFNPLVAILEGFRWSMIVGAPAVSVTAEIKSVAIIVFMLVSGAVFFARMERTIVDSV
ncbi:MAG TPA: ABC transporter permease [Candidatus Acidoferrales bacterium]|nr:ABC transporter permease [Candidatus Acidoferrales bacterium]